MYMQLETSMQIQTYMGKEDLAKMSGKESSIKLWMERNNLPENQRKVLMSDVQSKLRRKIEIDTETLILHLPILLRMEIKRTLCLPILRKVSTHFLITSYISLDIRIKNTLLGNFNYFSLEVM